ncbi:MAG: hypothetical protein CM1200mP17_17300 [Woeseia sp.]|nr:MAG: hypothetical protein CM1200mP17_17300 [Woeseia sp.]
MTSVSNRRSMMGLYSGNICIRSHQVRFVLSEKGIVTKIDNFDGKKIPEDLIALNPFATLPTLIDRELCLIRFKGYYRIYRRKIPIPSIDAS